MNSSFSFSYFFANTNPGAGLMTELLQQVCCDGRHLQSPVLLLIWMSSLIIPQFPTWQLIKEKPGDRIFRFNTYWIPKEFFFLLNWLSTTNLWHCVQGKTVVEKFSRFYSPPCLQSGWDNFAHILVCRCVCVFVCRLYNRPAYLILISACLNPLNQD